MIYVRAVGLRFSQVRLPSFIRANPCTVTSGPSRRSTAIAVLSTKDTSERQTSVHNAPTWPCSSTCMLRLIHGHLPTGPVRDSSPPTPPHQHHPPPLLPSCPHLRVSMWCLLRYVFVASLLSVFYLLSNFPFTATLYYTATLTCPWVLIDIIFYFYFFMFSRGKKKQNKTPTIRSIYVYVPTS